MNFKKYKIVVFVPESHADIVRDAMANAGSGIIGNYSHCTFSTKGIGRFKPLDGANPTIGSIGKLESVEEERIETICAAVVLDGVIAAIKSVHPYEEVALDVYPLI
ncbi:MAG: YqfO family protein [Candidatus Magasanikbacteria bacterium]|nr:YqfO family protein [Candidatus Magasanikbacteria bacterium]